MCWNVKRKCIFEVYKQTEAMTQLTNKQKNDLGEMVMHRLSGIVEFWGEGGVPEGLEDVPVDEIARQLSKWMNSIPSNNLTTFQLMV